MTHSATNWSQPEDNFSATFYERYTAQLWFPEEIPLANDALSWKNLSDAERLTYTRASAGLNALDTLQGELGMPMLHSLVEGHIRKATLQFQGTMEDIHARSYSLMNKTFLTSTEERLIFEWAETQPQLVRKLDLLKREYRAPAAHGKLGLWTRMAASCMLETALFYSGFFYPLYLAGQGRMVNAGEIFSLIIRDEALHGVYISMLAGELYAELSPADQRWAQEWFLDLAEQLYLNECAYTDEVYGELGLTGDVKAFVRSNFNVLCDNLGFGRIFPDEPVHPVVANGIKTHSTTHDFFSSKGNSYAKIAVAPLTDAAVEEAWNA